MILEAIGLIMAILVIVLPFCIWPIFIAMAVNASYKIVEGDNNEQ